MKKVWILPFITLDIAIPIISVEAVFPWIIGAFSTYLTIKLSKIESINFKEKIKIISGITFLSWIGYLIFYILVKRLGFNGGLLP